MTTPNGKHEFEAAKRFFEERLKDYLEQDKSLAAQDDPVGMVHPIYVGKLVKPYYRAAIAALQDYEKVKAEGKSLEEALDIAAKAYARLKVRAEKAEAELARWRPLIEAARAEDSEPSFVEVQLRAHMNCEKLERLLLAAQECRATLPERDK